MDEPVVTVICLAYNHAPYIRDALEGFVCQRTTFPVEVIVHDDASTDGTADIIREYAARYPHLFRPIYQKENQYSKGLAIAPTFCFPLVRGRYVALCEGDDYWTDPLKLQLQVEALEKHPEADLSAHCARMVRDGIPRGFMAPSLQDGVIPATQVVEGLHLATASLLCRRENYLTMTPMRAVKVNDLALQLQGARRGGLVYLSRCMSVYRIQTPGSWSATHRGLQRVEDRKTERKMMAAYDAWTAGEHHRAVRRRLDKLDTSDFLTQHRYLKLLAPRYLPYSVRRLGRTLLRLLRNLYCTIRWKNCS